jgi:hypothetical protein
MIWQALTRPAVSCANAATRLSALDVAACFVKPFSATVR